MTLVIQHAVDKNQHRVKLLDATYSCNIDGMEFKERLRQGIIKAAIKQTDLARALGVSVQTVNYWLTGRNKPGRERISLISKILGCSPAWLEFGDEPRVIFEGTAKKESNVVSFTLSIKQVPLISWVTAGQWAEISDNFHPGDGEDLIPCSSKCGPRSFALRVKGDSMEPDYPEGSVIVVDPEKEWRNGSDVVVRLNGEMEATFKKLALDGPRTYLKPINERYPVLDVTGKDFTICGVVVWTGREVS